MVVLVVTRDTNPPPKKTQHLQQQQQQQQRRRRRQRTTTPRGRQSRSRTQRGTARSLPGRMQPRPRTCIDGHECARKCTHARTNTHMHARTDAPLAANHSRKQSPPSESNRITGPRPARRRSRQPVRQPMARRACVWMAIKYDSQTGTKTRVVAFTLGVCRSSNTNVCGAPQILRTAAPDWLGRCS
jgi:hypothetical protein